MGVNGAGVVVAHADVSGFENLFRSAILEKLGDDKDALKAFEIQEYTPPTIDAAIAYKKLGRKLFNVAGALGLNDSGVGWKAFQFQIEEGLTDIEDRQVADQLAHQCLKCVAQMKREAKKATPV